jgi:enamine deaminase RidA (YjgF/YER057c/UK114 family)
MTGWEPIDAGLPDVAPISWGVRSEGPPGRSLIFTAHVPIREDGSFETGAIEDQAALTFENLRRTVEAAGGNLRDVLQVVIYLTDVGQAPAVSQVWAQFFSPPYPNRAIIGVSALTVAGMAIEITTVAMVKG